MPSKCPQFFRGCLDSSQMLERISRKRGSVGRSRPKPSPASGNHTQDPPPRGTGRLGRRYGYLRASSPALRMENDLAAIAPSTMYRHLCATPEPNGCRCWRIDVIEDKCHSNPYAPFCAPNAAVDD